MSGYVYLVWAKGTDMYKIGSSQYPEKRLPQLQTGSPVELELIGSRAVESYEFEEKRLHSFWSKFRVQGEWFQFHPTMLPAVLDSFGLASKWVQNHIEKARKEYVQLVAKALQDSLNECLPAYLASYAEMVRTGQFDGEVPTVTTTVEWPDD